MPIPLSHHKLGEFNTDIRCPPQKQETALTI